MLGISMRRHRSLTHVRVVVRVIVDGGDGRKTTRPLLSRKILQVNTVRNLYFWGDKKLMRVMVDLLDSPIRDSRAIERGVCFQFL